MATLPINAISPESTPTPTTAAEGGDQHANNGEMIPFIINTSDHTIIVTRPAQKQPFRPKKVDDDEMPCTAGVLTILPPVSPKWYNDKRGNVQLRYPVGEAANLQIFILRLPTAR